MPLYLAARSEAIPHGFSTSDHRDYSSTTEEELKTGVGVGFEPTFKFEVRDRVLPFKRRAYYTLPEPRWKSFGGCDFYSNSTELFYTKARGETSWCGMYKIGALS